MLPRSSLRFVAACERSMNGQDVTQTYQRGLYVVYSTLATRKGVIGCKNINNVQLDNERLAFHHAMTTARTDETSVYKYAVLRDLY